MKKSRNIQLMMLLALLVSACGSTTSITSSYKAPGVTQVAYKKIFIAALTANEAAKQTVENSISQYLATRGIASVKSSDVFPPNFHSSGEDKSKDTVLARVRATKCDGIFTIALINKETETSYVPGSANYYGSFGMYYGYGYGSFYSPGYYQTDKIYYIQTNLFDAQSEKLIWSAHSKTYNPESLTDFLKGYQKAITDQVVKDGLVAPSAK
jgi:hypothetical protein